MAHSLAWPGRQEGHDPHSATCIGLYVQWQRGGDPRSEVGLVRSQLTSHGPQCPVWSLLIQTDFPGGKYHQMDICGFTV